MYVVELDLSLRCMSACAFVGTADYTYIHLFRGILRAQSLERSVGFSAVEIQDPHPKFCQ